MRMVFGLVLVVGMGLAGFAVYMAKGYIEAYQYQLDAERQAAARIVPTVEVYVLTRAMRYGEKLRPEDVRAVAWPQNAIPEGTFLVSAKDLFPEGETGQRSALRAMERDEAVMRVKVTRPGEDAGVSSRLAAGMRAFAIQVDVQTGVSGFLRPGDRVDVYWTGQAVGADASRGGITTLIEPGVQIIAVDQSADGDRSGAAIARTITVQATPQQVANLAQAQATGRLSLSLVGVEDQSVAESRDVDQRSLLGVQERAVVPVQEERICTVRTRRGGEIIETPIECTN